MEQLFNIFSGILYGLKDSITGIYAIRYISVGSSGSSDPAAVSSGKSLSGSISSSSLSSRSSNEVLKSRGIVRNTNTAQKILQLCLLNGGIFWLSLILFDYILLPCLYLFLKFLFGSQTGLLNNVWFWTETILFQAFNAFWRIPVFVVSRIVNALWFQDIANATYRGRTIGKGVANSIADTLFSLMIQALFLLQVTQSTIHHIFSCLTVSGYSFTSCLQSLAVASIPFSYVGFIASFLHLSLLYSLYSFEYKWVNIGMVIFIRSNNSPSYIIIEC